MIEVEGDAWITVTEAVEVAHRTRSTIYRWVSDGNVRSSVASNGVIHVSGRDVLEAVSRIRRGRPGHG